MIAHIPFKKLIFHRVAKNTYWLLGDYLLRLLLGIIVFVLSARIFGPERFGMLNYALSFITLFLPLAGLGLDRIIVRDLVREQKKQNEILFTSFCMRFLSGSVMIVLSLVLISFLKPGDSTMLSIVGIFSSLLLFQAFDIFDYWFQSVIQSRTVVLVKAGIFIIFAFGKSLSLIIFPSLIVYVLLSAIESGLYGIGLLSAYLKINGKIPWNFNLLWAWKMMRQSYPLFLSGLFVIISMKIGQIIIGQVVSERQLGIYSAATRISETTYIIITATTASVFPLFAQLRKASRLKYYTWLQTFFDFSGGTALAISLSITLLAYPIIKVLFGIQYEESIQILQIHIWSTIPVFLSTTQGIWNINEGYTHIHLFQAFGTTVCTIASLILFLPRFGIVSVAWISVLSPFISMVVINLLNTESRKILRYQLQSLFVLKHLGLFIRHI
jgi:PST family polysaccharide transporter